MPRTPKSVQPNTPQPPVPREFVLISEAARRCGWRRANTFREKFLATEEDAASMGLAYDEHGRAVVDSSAVEAAVATVERERASREPDWRVKNLGRYARPRPTKRAPSRERRQRRKKPKQARA